MQSIEIRSRVADRDGTIHRVIIQMNCPIVVCSRNRLREADLQRGLNPTCMLCIADTGDSFVAL